MRLSKHIIQGKVAKKVAGVEYAAQAGYHWRALSLVIKQGGAARPTLTLIQRNKHGIQVKATAIPLAAVTEVAMLWRREARGRAPTPAGGDTLEDSYTSTEP